MMIVNVTGKEINHVQIKRDKLENDAFKGHV